MYLQAKSAARLLDLPISTFYQLVREGRLPPAVSKVGKHQLWHRDDLIATVDPHRYNHGHGHAQAAARHPQEGNRKREGEVLLPPGSGNAKRGTARALTRQSPFYGVLG